ncbi:MAG: sulfotransferase domain-containing protein [Flavobacteriales bacterium]|nr:sulfotransferase domain-containing protein [Flavobacteriales bacterium]
MKEVLIHIGFHKTGTTWLQNEMFVAQNKTFCPLSTRDNKRSSLAWHFIFDEHQYLLNSFDLNETIIKRELDAILKKKEDQINNRIYVMSHERLCGYSQSGGFDSSIIAGRIKNIFPKGKILILLREQKSFIKSDYFQYLSVGGTHGFEKYLNLKYDGKRPGFSPNHINYYPIVSKYQELFGKENVLVLPYELFKKDKLDFIKRLSVFVGETIDVETANFNAIWNKKKSFFLNYRLRILNVFRISSSLNNNSFLAIKISIRLIRLIFSVLGRLIPKQFDRKIQENIEMKTKKWVDGRYDESNRAVAELIDLDLSQFGYY